MVLFGWLGGFSTSFSECFNGDFRGTTSNFLVVLKFSGLFGPVFK